jgi:hypothetical protein
VPEFLRTMNATPWLVIGRWVDLWFFFTFLSLVKKTFIDCAPCLFVSLSNYILIDQRPGLHLFTFTFTNSRAAEASSISHLKLHQAP